MDVITTNDEIKKVDYNKNIYFTDCSNPLSFGFINRNFITNGEVSDTQGVLLFDGSILKNANVDLKAISGTIKFLIHIKNNLGENFICDVLVENNLYEKEEIMNGYSMRIYDLENSSFIKVLDK